MNEAATTINTDEDTTTDEQAAEPQEAPQEAQEGPQGATEEHEETFPRSYVEKLRKEAGDHRAKAKDRDTLARRLHAELVAKTGRLQDPTDLPFDEAHLDDAEAMETAIKDLLDAKPHLASRRPRGDIGQGAASTSQTVDLAAILRSRA